MDDASSDAIRGVASPERSRLGCLQRRAGYVLRQCDLVSMLAWPTY